MDQLHVHRRPGWDGAAVTARLLSHEEKIELLSRIRRDPGPMIRLPTPRCIQCAAKVGPWEDYTIYDATLGRARRPYCPRCYGQIDIIERSVQS